MYALLFFLPIYYKVIKERSAMATALFLLAQTLMMAPCAIVVVGLVQTLGLSYRWTVTFGWLATTCGIGLLYFLGSNTTVVSDVLLNLLSGFGIGFLLPALALAAKDSTGDADALEASMVLVFMRYLGSALGLVLVGFMFQTVLRINLRSTKFKDEADKMTKYATTLMYSIHEMSSSQDKQVLIQATEATLRTIWLALSAGSFIVFLLSCVTLVIIMRRKVKAEEKDPELSAGGAPQLVLEPELEPGFLWQQDGKLKVFLHVSADRNCDEQNCNGAQEEVLTDKKLG